MTRRRHSLCLRHGGIVKAPLGISWPDPPRSTARCWPRRTPAACPRKKFSCCQRENIRCATVSIGRFRRVCHGRRSRAWSRTITGPRAYESPLPHAPSARPTVYVTIRPLIGNGRTQMIHAPMPLRGTGLSGLSREQKFRAGRTSTSGRSSGSTPRGRRSASPVGRRPPACGSEAAAPASSSPAGPRWPAP